MTSALRWAAMRAILMLHNCEGQSHKTVSTDHNFWSKRGAKADSNEGPLAWDDIFRAIFFILPHDCHHLFLPPPTPTAPPPPHTHTHTPNTHPNTHPPRIFVLINKWMKIYTGCVKTSTQNLVCSQPHIHTVHTCKLLQVKLHKNIRTSKVHTLTHPHHSWKCNFIGRGLYPFLTGRTFVHEHSWEYSVNIAGS